MRDRVVVKCSLNEGGIGSVAADIVSETTVTEYGEFAYIARSEDGRYFLAVTDMEVHYGCMVGFELDQNDPWIAALVKAE